MKSPIKLFTSTLFIAFWMNMPAYSQDASFVNGLLNQAKLQGAGKFTYWGFDVYDAKLYRSGITTSPEFALDIRYFRSFSGLAIAKKSAQEMQNFGVPARQADIWGRQLAGILPDVERGQSLTAIYLPKQGTVFFHEGKQLGEIPDTQFAKAFFGIWLDPNTSAPKLRNQLLGESCPPPLMNETC
jgi:Chalcone isomerase-like